MFEDQQRPAIQRTTPASKAGWFFLITFGWSWGFWIPAALFGLGAEHRAVQVLGLAGLLGPTVGAVSLLLTAENAEMRRDYRMRVFDLKRVGWRWLLLVLLLPAVALLLSVLFDFLAGQAVQWAEPARRVLHEPWSIIPFAFFILLFGPVPEELGWRGYALDRLQARWSPALASLLLGTGWAAWHLPIFWIEGTYQSRLGVGSVLFWTFLISLLAQAVVMTWVHNHSGRSISATILFHFAVNFTGELAAVSTTAQALRTLWWIVLASAILASSGARKNLQTQDRRQESAR